MKIADVPRYGIVIGINSGQAEYYFEDEGRLTEERMHHTLDLLLQNVHGEYKLVRVAVGQDVAEFFHLGGRPPLMPVLFKDIPKVEPIGTAQEPGGTCPICQQPQYRNSSGVACLNGHGFAEFYTGDHR